MDSKGRSTSVQLTQVADVERGASAKASDSSIDKKNGAYSDQAHGGGLFSDHDEIVPGYGAIEDIHHPANKDDILTHTLHVEDDPSERAITFRSLFVGCGLATFGGTISAIYYFKPQTIIVSIVFLAVISYILGEGLSLIIPRKGFIGRWLNPHPFNKKEHVTIIIMANSASISALGIQLLAVERLYYNHELNGGIAIFLLLSSQYLGYGIAGLMRRSLVYPKNMMWPVNLPVTNMLETLHRPRSETRKQLKVFGIVFACIFCWEIVPEWIMPILTGVSIFCLANQNSAVFTTIFGGASGDEGLGLFSICLDWQYISGGLSPLYFPMDSLISQGIGICLCCVVFSGVYYGNIWNAKSFPFLSQQLFANNSTFNDYTAWNQTAVIGPDNKVDPAGLAQVGLPSLAATYAINILVTNMSTTAGITHILLWYWNDIKGSFSFLRPSEMKKWLIIFRPREWNFDFVRRSNQPVPMQDNYDPHYRLMLNYKAVPDWWFGVVFVCSFVVALVILYTGTSTLPWWNFLIAVVLAWFLLIFFASMWAVSGVQFLIQPVVQMIGGYILPGNPVANMYFTLYGYNSLGQGELLSSDLKLAQYCHLAPRVTFFAQMLGTAIGAIFNYIMMNSIVTNQRDVLLSVQGTNVWSGQQPQAFNTLAITWGGLPHELFNVGKLYDWLVLVYPLGFLAPIPFYIAHRMYPRQGWNNINSALVITYISWLCVGINSSLMMYFIIGLGSQYYLRKYKPNLFLKYNYLVSAALDGGTSVIVFIMSFALFGAAGNAVNFPIYWGNNANGNYDRCASTNG